MLLFSISTVFAGNNETVSDIVGATDNLDDVVQLQDIPDTQSSKSDEQILTAGNNVINVVNVMDSYNETGKTWSTISMPTGGKPIYSNNYIEASYATQIYNTSSFTNRYHPARCLLYEFARIDNEGDSGDR